MRQLIISFYRLGLMVVFLAFFLIPVLAQPTTAQQVTETWGDFINKPEMGFGDLRTAQEHLNDERIIMSIFSGIPCKEEEYPVSPSASLPACWYDTSGHRTTQGGQGYIPAGKNKAGFMKDFSTLLFPTSYPNTLIEQTAGYDRAWIRQGKALKASLVEDPSGNNPNFWVWDSPASLELKDENGNPFYFHGNYLYAQSTFSNNGRWLLLFDVSGYLIRIDLKDLTISTYRVTNDEYFWPAISISDTGRYIAVNNRVDEFFILDTKGCTEPRNFIRAPSTEKLCTIRDIGDYARKYYESLDSLYPLFYTDGVLRLRGISKNGDGEEWLMRAPNTRLNSNYIALGDSFSSGEGAYRYLPGTDEPNNRCHVSDRSYPFLLDSWMGLDSVHSVACSGARMHNILGGHPNEAAQNKRETTNKALGKWIPGYKWQRDFVKDPDIPLDVITIGISGNDIGFSDKITQCLKPGNCFESLYDRVGIALEINDQFEKLVNIFSTLRRDALNKSPLARVYAVGYPQIFNPSGSIKGLCGANVHLSYEELSMGGNLISLLNDMIQQAAARAGVAYVSIETALYGYRLCDSPYTLAVNGLTVGEGGLPFYLGPIAAESYHPAYFGHTLIASAIRQRTDGFTLPMPRPDKNAVPPDPLRNMLVGNASDITTEIRKHIYAGDISTEVVVKGSSQYLFLNGTYRLRVGSSATVLYRSEPTHVGEFLIDERGELAATYAVPESLDPGIHTLHIYGEDIEGRKLDIYKTVYVAESVEDWDGDGILNNEESCGVFNAIGIDEDGDGIDDACDNIIEVPRSQLNTSSLSYNRTVSGVLQKAHSSDVRNDTPFPLDSKAQEEKASGALTEEGGGSYAASTALLAALLAPIVSIALLVTRKDTNKLN